jgi:hypothetical protein
MPSRPSVVCCIRLEKNKVPEELAATNTGALDCEKIVIPWKRSGVANTEKAGRLRANQQLRTSTNAGLG